MFADEKPEDRDQLDEVDLDDELGADDDLEEDDLEVDDLGADDLEDDDLEDDDAPLVVSGEDEDEEDEDEDATLPGDEEEEGEASLEELLAERSTARRATDDAEDEDEDIMALVPEPDIPVDDVVPVKVLPVKDEEEFVCARCHLVKKKVQLVDPARQLCRDCA